MKNHGTRLLFYFAIVAACALAWAHYGLTLGQDLAGGASLTYKVRAETEGEAQGDVDQKRLKRLLEILDKRLNKFGVADINPRATDDSRIVLELPGRGADRIKDIKKLVEQNGDLILRIVATDSVARAEREKRRSTPAEFYKLDTKYKWVPDETAPAGVDNDWLVEIPEGPKKLELEAATKAGDEAKVKQIQDEIEEIEDREIFTGAMLSSTDVVKPQIQFVVTFEFVESRQGAFGDFTERNVERQMGIILDGKMSSAPVINEKLPGGGQISGGGGGGFKYDEANQLRIVLESGATGVQLELESEEVVGPSLGEDAIRRGILSIAIGLIAVLVIMVWIYRLPGLVANVALIMNMVILLGALAFFDASLTLPGIAGVVLTLGMAVDANILIFERIREEQDRGKSVLEALASGYDRALVAIVDASATTVLTALVLIYMGSGSVKGFGVTLTLGIVASMFTAILVTRAILEGLVENEKIKEVNLGIRGRAWKLDFMARRRFFTGPSLVAMAIGFAFFMGRDEMESKDLEFIGGVDTTVQLSKAVSIEDVRARIQVSGEYQAPGIVTLESQGIEEAAPGTTNRFRIRNVAADEKAGDAFIAHLEKPDVLGDWLLSPPITDVEVTPARGTDPATIRLVFHTLGNAPDPGVLQAALAEQDGLGKATVEAVPGDPKALGVLVTTGLPEDTVRRVVVDAARSLDEPAIPSEAMPSRAFLTASRAEQLWRSALQAVLVALVIQVMYIRLRFADYKHGFAAVCALLHDSVIALGCVALVDATGLVHAKINLVLIAAFLTLIGYSMNDTIVVFDRIRENMGRGRVVLSDLVNQSLNQTLTRSIRTSLTTLAVVLIQFVFNWNSGSVLEGFAFVMVVGVISGTYSSIFIAAPLLLFLPVFWKEFASRPRMAAAQVVATLVGLILAVTAKGHGVQMYAGTFLAANVAIHFLVRFVPWLGFTEPDSLLQEEVQAEADERPLAKPGI